MIRRILFAVALPILTLLLLPYVPVTRADVPALELQVGTGVHVSITPLRIDGLDVTFQASSPAHPGLLRFTVAERGTYYDAYLGDTLWQADAGQAATALLTVHLQRSPSRTAIVRLRVSSESSSAIALLPGAGGTLSLTTATGCGAPLASPPTSAEIRKRLTVLDPPVELAGIWRTVAGAGDQDLPALFQAAAQVVHCTSAGAAPVHPELVPADQVKAWLTTVVMGPSSPWAMLRPIAEALPPPAIQWGYLRAVELKRALPAGSLK